MTPVTIRASSLSGLFDCPARWVAVHMEGRRSPQSGAAALGTAIHAGTAVFDSERVARQVPSLSAAEDAAVESVRQPRQETIWDEEGADKAEKIARSLVSRYCTIESPRHEFVAVEASVESLHITDLGIVLTGHVDRVCAAESGHGIADLKSGKTAVSADGTVKTQGHGAQLGVYELVAEAATGLRITEPAQIIGLQTNVTPEKQRIGRAEVHGAREVLLGDGDNPGLLAIASQIVHGAIPAWGNPRSMLCSVNYCPNFATCFWRK
jgi:hypothetical protein